MIPCTQGGLEMCLALRGVIGLGRRPLSAACQPDPVNIPAWVQCHRLFEICYGEARIIRQLRVAPGAGEMGEPREYYQEDNSNESGGDGANGKPGACTVRAFVHA